MHKLKQTKKHILELDPKITAAIDKTVEAAISCKLEGIDSHITEVIKTCMDQKSTFHGDRKIEKKIYCADAGP